MFWNSQSSLVTMPLEVLTDPSIFFIIVVTQWDDSTIGWCSHSMMIATKRLSSGLLHYITALGEKGAPLPCCSASIEYRLDSWSSFFSTLALVIVLLESISITRKLCESRTNNYTINNREARSTYMYVARLGALTCMWRTLGDFVWDWMC